MLKNFLANFLLNKLIFIEVPYNIEDFKVIKNSLRRQEWYALADLEDFLDRTFYYRTHHLKQDQIICMAEGGIAMRYLDSARPHGAVYLPWPHTPDKILKIEDMEEVFTAAQIVLDQSKGKFLDADEAVLDEKITGLKRELEKLIETRGQDNRK